MTEMILETETGGSPITSYSMDWDEGSSGNQYVPMVGFYDDNLNLSIEFTQLTKGLYYRFRYRVKNIYGWSDYSDIVIQIAARTPDVPVAPVTSNTQTSVTITWEIPYNGGTPVTSYSLLIKTHDDLWVEELTYCNAVSDSTVISNRLCAIPMSVLEDEPFMLEQSSLVVAKVGATNLLGTSDYSEENSVGALI
jgi:hypothetical protein